MTKKKIDKIPASVVYRLSRYYRVLSDSIKQGWVSSKELSDLTGLTAAQIRKDLAYFGEFGSPGRGYNNEELKTYIKRILGIDRIWNVLLVGVGNLGTALLSYKGFKDQGFNIVAAFDIDKNKIGSTISGIEILSLDKLQKIIKQKDIQMAILTVPEQVAQMVAEILINSGIKSILNFSPVSLKLPDSIKVRNIDMTIEIEHLAFLMSKV